MIEFVKQQFSWMGWNQKIKAAENDFYKVNNHGTADKSIKLPTGAIRKPAWREKPKSLSELVRSFDLLHQLA